MSVTSLLIFVITLVKSLRVSGMGSFSLSPLSRVSVYPVYIYISSVSSISPGTHSHSDPVNQGQRCLECRREPHRKHQRDSHVPWQCSTLMSSGPQIPRWGSYWCSLQKKSLRQVPKTQSLEMMQSRHPGWVPFLYQLKNEKTGKTCSTTSTSQ